MSSYTTLLTSSHIEINRLAALLEEAGITIHIKDHTKSARLAGFGTPQNKVELLVDKAGFERAKSIIATAQKKP